MTRQILSVIHTLDHNIANLNSSLIEKELEKVYGEIIRWAIIKVENQDILLSVTYVNNTSV